MKSGEIYFFVLSVILVLLTAFLVVNLALIRRGKTIFGISIRPGTPEYKRGMKLARPRNILIATVVAVLAIVNLIYDISRMRSLDGYSSGLLLFLAAFILLLFVVVVPFARRQARDIYEAGKANRRK